MAKKNREYYMDYLRAFLISWVILGHATMIYGSRIVFLFYKEIPYSNSPSSQWLDFFYSTSFVGLFNILFLMTGYHARDSINRKGYKKFLYSRLVRLGIPWVIFVSILGPISFWLGKRPNGVTLIEALHQIWV